MLTSWQDHDERPRQAHFLCMFFLRLNSLDAIFLLGDGQSKKMLLQPTLRCCCYLLLFEMVRGWLAGCWLDFLKRFLDCCICCMWWYAKKKKMMMWLYVYTATSRIRSLILNHFLFQTFYSSILARVIKIWRVRKIYVQIHEFFCELRDNKKERKKRRKNVDKVGGMMLMMIIIGGDTLPLVCSATCFHYCCCLLTETLSWTDSHLDSWGRDRQPTTAAGDRKYLDWEKEVDIFYTYMCHTM